MRTARVVLLCSTLVVGCVDEDTNSDTGSAVTVDGAQVADADGADGVVVDCSSLFSSRVALDAEENGVHVSVSFPADAKPGDTFILPATGVTVSIETTDTWTIARGQVVVDANSHDGDLRVAATLNAVTDTQGRVASGSLDCLETLGDTGSHSCASACAGGGGGGGGHHDFDD